MKKIVVGFMVLVMCSILMFSFNEKVLSLVGKVIKFEENVVLVKEFKYFEKHTPVMVFKSLTTGQLEERDVTKTNFEDIIKWDIISNSEAEYLAKIKQEKQEQQNLLIEKEKYYEDTNKSVNGNPFALFMGMKWGINATEFKNNFKYKLRTYSEGFALYDFPLGTLEIKMILFIFKNSGTEKELKFIDKNYNQFTFNRVVMAIKPEQFENLLDIFTKKYGKPLKLENSKIQNRMGADFLQTIAYWEKDDRAISLNRYGNKIDEGFAAFVSKEGSKEKKEKEKEMNEKAADIL